MSVTSTNGVLSGAAVTLALQVYPSSCAEDKVAGRSNTMPATKSSCFKKQKGASFQTDTASLHLQLDPVGHEHVATVHNSSLGALQHSSDQQCSLSVVSLHQCSLLCFQQCLYTCCSSTKVLREEEFQIPAAQHASCSIPPNLIKTLNATSTVLKASPHQVPAPPGQQALLPLLHSALRY